VFGEYPGPAAALFCLEHSVPSGVVIVALLCRDGTAGRTIERRIHV